MSQLGNYEDLIKALEETLIRRGAGQGLSMDADFILTSFGSIKCLEFVFEVFDKDSDLYVERWGTDYPLMSAYMRNLDS